MPRLRRDSPYRDGGASPCTLEDLPAESSESIPNRGLKTEKIRFDLHILPRKLWHILFFTGNSIVAVPKTIKFQEMKKMKSNNSINIPEAREAMDQFKMEAARDEDVPTPS